MVSGHGRNGRTHIYPDLRSLYPPVEQMLKQFAELTEMNPIDPDRMNRSRRSGNDELTSMESTDADELTANRAALVANELRGETHVKNAEAVHVRHRHGLEEWYQVNVLLSRSTLHPDIFERLEDDYDISLRKPQATEDGNLLLQYEVAEVEVNESGTTGNDALRQAEIDDLTEVAGVGQNKAEALWEAGYTNVTALQTANQSALAEVEGIGNALAARIKADVGKEVWQ